MSAKSKSIERRRERRKGFKIKCKCMCGSAHILLRLMLLLHYLCNIPPTLSDRLNSLKCGGGGGRKKESKGWRKGVGREMKVKERKEFQEKGNTKIKKVKEKCQVTSTKHRNRIFRTREWR